MQLDAPWFGGWSGIEIGAQGAQMTVINDRGQLVTASLQRANGRISGVGVQSVTALGKAVGGRLGKKASDAEGIAIANDGTAFVSFEQMLGHA